MFRGHVATATVVPIRSRWRYIDSIQTIRLTAVASLGQLAERGDESVVKLLISRLAHENESDAHMRWTAMAGLAQVAAKGSQITVSCRRNQFRNSVRTDSESFQISSRIRLDQFQISLIVSRQILVP